MSTLDRLKSNNNCIGRSIFLEHLTYFHWTVWKSFDRNVYLTNVQNMNLWVGYSESVVFSSITACMQPLPMSTLNRRKSNNNCIGCSIIVEHFSYFCRTVWKKFCRNVYLTNVQNMKVWVVCSQSVIISSIFASM